MSGFMTGNEKKYVKKYAIFYQTLLHIEDFIIQPPPTYP